MRLKKEAIVLLLGSNVGEREEHLRHARQGIEALVGKILRQSDVLETAPWGKEDQAAFLNQALLVKTLYPPQLLLQMLLSIEKGRGRIREEKWGPRTLDIDLIFYGHHCIQSNQLIVPHPHMQDRDFVLKPMSQIVPHWKHPVLKQSVRELLIKLEKK